MAMRTMLRAFGCVGCLVIAVTSVAAQPQKPSLPRVAFDERLAAPAVLASALADGTTPAFPLMARVVVTRADLQPTPGTYAFERLDERLDRYAKRGVDVWLSINDMPDGLDAAERWGAFVRALVARCDGRVRLFELTTDGRDPKIAAYLFKLAATEIHGRDEQALVGLGTKAGVSASTLEALYREELAPYVDAVSLPASIGTDARRAIERVLARTDSSARLLLTDVVLGGPAHAAARRFIEEELEGLGTTPLARSYRAEPALVRQALAASRTIADLLTGELVPLDPDAASLRLGRRGRDVTKSVRYRLLYSVETFATYLVYWGDETSGDALDVSLSLSLEGNPVLRDPFDGAAWPVDGDARDASTRRIRARVPWRPGPLIVDFNQGATAMVGERQEVTGRRSLSVEEIIARHQRQQVAQDAVVDHYTAIVRMEQHFRPALTDPGYDIVSENRYFVRERDIEWEELSFSVNGTRWGPDRPPFPLLQPEKVLSLPLDLRFTADYRYRLVGTERVAERECYVVRFDPVHGERSLYRGRVWIDRETFARLKVQAVQTALSAPVVSNEEIQTFARVATVDGRPVMLLTDLSSRQLLLIAGRNVLVEKRVRFSEVRVNDPEFDRTRDTARASDRVMYKETGEGLRYFVKEGERRVVSERPTLAAKAMAMGTTIDPSFDFPLPIFGINYLDFEFGSPNSQLALLFGGVLAAGNIQWPRLGGTPLDASVDFFAIAVPSTDRVYDRDDEREAERLLTWPMTMGVNVGYQFTDFQKVGLRYHLGFDAYANERTTSETFVRPSSTLTNGVGATYELRRHGYNLTSWATWFGRTRWRPWGPADELDPGEKTYIKYGGALARDIHFHTFHKIHVDAAYFGGERLDRFSKYQFGLFDDTRIHGVPASGLRFTELAALRASYSFNIFEQYRLDLFAARAWGRDEDLSKEWQPITGIGVGVNVRAPWRTILRVDVSKSFLPRQYRALGSTVVQVLLLKPL
ncbi:MAG: sigma-E factor regulatory protein RseB domain-containing protein [Vicinamibacteraceae bacterium]